MQLQILNNPYINNLTNNEQTELSDNLGPDS